MTTINRLGRVRRPRSAIPGAHPVIRQELLVRRQIGRNLVRLRNVPGVTEYRPVRAASRVPLIATRMASRYSRRRTFKMLIQLGTTPVVRQFSSLPLLDDFVVFDLQRTGTGSTNRLLVPTDRP